MAKFALFAHSLVHTSFVLKMNNLEILKMNNLEIIVKRVNMKALLEY